MSWSPFQVIIPALYCQAVRAVHTFSSQHPNFKNNPLFTFMADGIVNLHDLDSFALRTQLKATKGANLFSVFSRIEIQDGLIPQVITRLAVAVRRKMIVFSWQDSEFMDTKVRGSNRRSYEHLEKQL